MTRPTVAALTCAFSLLLNGAWAAEPEPGKVSKHDGMPQVLIAAGEFTMGADDEDALGRQAEFPPHRVHLDAYWIDQHEVTNAQFAAFLNAGVKGNAQLIYLYCDPGDAACRIGYDWESGVCSVDPSYENHPVCSVSWQGAEAYARHVRRRLPTEAQWEKAARGTDGRRYPWGNEWAVGKLNACAGDAGDTRAVGTVPGDRSPYGVWDLGGNVREWVADAWQEDYYLTCPLRNPVNEGPAPRYVVRGAAWCLTEWDARVTSRQFLIGLTQRRYMGFRCAEAVPELLPPPAAVSADVRFYAPMDGAAHAAAAAGERRPVKAPAGLGYVAGHRGQAALLGADTQRRYWVDYDTEGNLALAQGTVSLWVQPRGWDGDAPGFRYFFMLRDVALCKFYLYRFVETNLLVLAGNGIEGQWGGISTPTAGWQDGEWVHLAVTWQGREFALYVNGEQKGRTLVPEDKQFRGLPAVFSIGQSQDWDSSKYVAQTAIDEVVIFRRALTPAEVVKERDRTELP